MPSKPAVAVKVALQTRGLAVAVRPVTGHGDGDIGGIQSPRGLRRPKRDRRSGVGLVQAGIDDVDGDRRDAGDGVGLGVGGAGGVACGVSGGDGSSSTVLSLSAPRSAPGTLIEKVLSANTRPVKVLLTVRVTVSPTLASPPTTPVTGMLRLVSAMLMMSSEVMLASSVMVGAARLGIDGDRMGQAGAWVAGSISGMSWG